MNAEKNKSLFGYVNDLVRSGKYYEAMFGYELLEEINPGFHWYEFNKKSTLKKMKLIGVDKNLIKNKYHYQSAANYQKRLRVAHIFSTMGNYAAVSSCFDDLSDYEDAQHLLSKANATVGDPSRWLSSVNSYLKFNGMKSISIKKSGENIFQKLKKPDAVISASVNGPLVTVCMSCFNMEAYVEKAVTSILQQTYKNIELIVFNDCSVDGTLAILKKMAAKDSRVILIDNKNNQGTYVSRNQAFQRAKGEFFTILDGDDYALPDRIETQVKHLLENPEHMGVVTEWVRMESNGTFHFKGGWGGCYQHEAVATLMLRTRRVQNDIGYWDSVRFAADTEFFSRMQAVYGKVNVPLLKKPTVISLFHEESLTNHPITGISVNGVRGLSPVRIQYRDSWMKWHTKNRDKLFLNFPLEERLFEAPDEMCIR